MTDGGQGFLISIHAPRAGCDVPSSCVPTEELKISIHAPRAGCDMRVVREHSFYFRFQSTHPVRGATGTGSYVYALTWVISIHAPRAGCDFARLRVDAVCCISIHAPRAGCDLRRRALLRSTRNFNPRTPCGVRRACLVCFPLDLQISIHAPRAGCDCKHAQLGLLLFLQLHQIGCMLAFIILVLTYNFNRKCDRQSHSAVRSAPNIHVCFRFAPCQSISNPSGA